MPELKEVLGEELYKQVVEKAGDKHKIAVVSDGQWFPKEKFDEANTAKKAAEDALKDRDNQLAELKKSAGDNEALKEQISKLQNDNKTASEQYAKDMEDLKLATALKLTLAGEAHDPELVAGLLDKTLIELNEDGSIKGGLDDQLKGLRESKAFLFTEKPKGPKFKGIQPPEGSEPNREQSPQMAELTAQYQKAVESKNFTQQIALKNQMFELQKAEEKG